MITPSVFDHPRYAILCRALDFERDATLTRGSVDEIFSYPSIRIGREHRENARAQLDELLLGERDFIYGAWHLSIGSLFTDPNLVIRMRQMLTAEGWIPRTTRHESDTGFRDVFWTVGADLPELPEWSAAK